MITPHTPTKKSLFNKNIKVCFSGFYFKYYFLGANAIIITLILKMCSKIFLEKFAKLCVYLSFHFSYFLYVSMLEITCVKAIIPYLIPNIFLFY